MLLQRSTVSQGFEENEPFLDFGSVGHQSDRISGRIRMHKFSCFGPPNQEEMQSDVSIGRPKCGLVHQSPIFWDGNNLVQWEYVSRGVWGCFMFSASIYPKTKMGQG